jgi:hypothetical protein
MTALLRLMLGFLSFFKLIIWSISLALPNKRELAKKELRSNVDVIGLCISLA